MSLIGLPAGIEEIIIASLVLFVSTLIYKFLMNQSDAREIKLKLKEKQEKLKELQKSNPEEAKREMAEMLKLSNKQMRMTMKPMFVTLILFVAVVFPTMPGLFPGIIVKLPFTLPYFGDKFGWLMWYFIVSLPLNFIFRRLLGVEI